MIEAEIYVTLKKTVADPQGLTMKHALESLGNDSIEDLRIGKMVKVQLKTDDEAKANELLEDMCKKLLANPVIEDYKFIIK